MWFLILVLLVVMGLFGIVVSIGIRDRRRRKACGDDDFATRDRGGVDPRLRETNEADANIRSNGRLREMQNQPWNGGNGGTF